MQYCRDQKRNETTWHSCPFVEVNLALGPVIKGSIAHTVYITLPVFSNHISVAINYDKIRNKFYLNLSGQTFADLSGVSGADDISDSRTWAALDYDRDGWTDIALVNANAPLLSLYRNRIGELKKSNHIKILLVGGADGKVPDQGLSNRDGIGAVVEVMSGDRSIKRIRRLGDGYAAQNSSTMTVGIGSEVTVQSIKVRWPSGKITKRESPVSAGSVIIMNEVQ